MRSFISTCFFTFFSCLAFGAFAQGVISGTIKDEKTGEALIGANIVIEGTGTGSATDLDGKYQFEAAAGTYVVVITYTGYQDKKISEVVVKEKETTFLDATLSDEAIKLDVEVVITAKAIQRSENAILLLQKKSDKIQDGISSQEMTRYGVSDAANAMRKVTGATVQDGRYIFIRGLGDRYSLASLNGIQLPSSDPYRNSAQLDLIPSNLLENIITSKTFTPDQPGTFTGGNIDLRTRSFPERKTFTVSIGAAYNTQSTGNDGFLTYEGGNGDRWGYGTESRAIPEILTTDEAQTVLIKNAYLDARNNNAKAQLIDQASKITSRQFVPTSKTAPFNQKASISFGDQFSIGGKPLGVLFSANYGNDFTLYENARSGNFFINDAGSNDLVSNFELNDSKAVENPNVGAFAGLSYKFSPNSTVSASYIYNHNAEKIARNQFGSARANSILPPDVFTSRTLHFRERALSNLQILGEHLFTSLNETKVEWAAGWANSSLDEPDLRYFASSYFSADDAYNIDLASYPGPTHFWRELADKQFEGKIDITIPFAQKASKANKIKIGGLYAQKERDFAEKRYEVFESPNSVRYNGDPSFFFSDANTGLLRTEGTRNVIGNYIANVSDARNLYTGDQDIWAAYAMGTFQLSERLKAIAGVRIESTKILVEGGNIGAADSLRLGKIDQVDPLPSANLIYSLTEKSNLRVSASQTIARPNMRELAPFYSFEFISDAIFYGNPTLKRTLIQNYDLRYELFPNAGEVFAISAFYKRFKDPIIRENVVIASNPEFRLDNVDQAQVYGLELELRKDLSFISEKLQNFKFGSNLSLIKSTVDIPEGELNLIRFFNPQFSGSTRQFIGQSPVILNVNLSYVDSEKGFDAVLGYNFFGSRLDIVGTANTVDAFERGRGQLDFVISKAFKRYQMRFNALNLLNPKYEVFSEFKGNDYVLSSYKTGLTLGLTLSYVIK